MSENQDGSLEIVLGCMFAGKTTKLVEEYKKYTYIGRKVLVINYMEDTRYDNIFLSTHDKIMIPCKFASTISEMEENIKENDVILINEGQFFSDIYESVLNMVDNQGKTVIICGLDGDFKRNRFGRLLDLIPHCDKVTKLSALCAKCRNGKPGIFSHRLSNEDSQVVIGSDNYIPLCRSCYKTVSKPA